MRLYTVEFRQPDGTWFFHTDPDKISALQVATNLANSPNAGEIQVRDPDGYFIYYAKRRK